MRVGHSTFQLMPHERYTTLPGLPESLEARASMFSFHVDPFQRIDVPTSRNYIRWLRHVPTTTRRSWPRVGMNFYEHVGVRFVDPNAVEARILQIQKPTEYETPLDILNNPIEWPRVDAKVVEASELSAEEKQGMFQESFNHTDHMIPSQTLEVTHYRVHNGRVLLREIVKDHGKSHVIDRSLDSIDSLEKLFVHVEVLKNERHISYAEVQFDDRTMIYFYAYRGDRLVPFAEFVLQDTGENINGKETPRENYHTAYFALLDEQGGVIDYLYVKCKTNSAIQTYGSPVEYSSFADAKKAKSAKYASRLQLGKS